MHRDGPEIFVFCDSLSSYEDRQKKRKIKIEGAGKLYLGVQLLRQDEGELLRAMQMYMTKIQVCVCVCGFVIKQTGHDISSEIRNGSFPSAD